MFRPRKQIHKREEFNRMIADCIDGKIDMVITKSISRFARNTLDCLKYIRQLKERNIPVFFEKENINTLDAKGEVLLTIMASLAQQESQSLSQNVKMGLQFRYQRGEVQVNHSRFLGYTKDENSRIFDKEFYFFCRFVRCVNGFLIQRHNDNDDNKNRNNEIQ